jgi:predicted RecA/RadA family phage recombinase
MFNFVQAGDTIPITAPYTVTSGGGVQIGGLFGVACDDITSGAAGQIKTTGVFDLTKATGVVAVGDDIYWDNANKVVTTVAAASKRIGVAVAASLEAGATARVRLDGSNNPRVFVSAEQTGTGSAQNVAHGLGETPAFVLIAPTDLTPSTVGQYSAVEGTHTATNVVVTVTASKKFKVLAIAG